MQHLEVSGVPVLYTGRTVPKGILIPKVLQVIQYLTKYCSIYLNEILSKRKLVMRPHRILQAPIVSFVTEIAEGLVEFQEIAKLKRTTDIQ